MKKCEHCLVEVKTKNTNCPLCYRELKGGGKKTGVEPYKMRERDLYKKSKVFLYKLFLFLSIVITSACVLINLLTKTFPLWSLVVAIAILYCWVLICHTIISKRSIFEKLLLQIGSFMAFLFACEMMAQGDKWMVDYVIPSISMMVVFVLFVLAQVLKYNKGVFAYFIVTLILTLISGGLLLFGASHYMLLNIIAVVVGGISILGMIIFNGRVLKTEISKKFHV